MLDAPLLYLPDRIPHVGARHTRDIEAVLAISGWYALPKNIGQSQPDGGVLTGMGRRGVKRIVSWGSYRPLVNRSGAPTAPNSGAGANPRPRDKARVHRQEMGFQPRPITQAPPGAPDRVRAGEVVRTALSNSEQQRLFCEAAHTSNFFVGNAASAFRFASRPRGPPWTQPAASPMDLGRPPPQSSSHSRRPVPHALELLAGGSWRSDQASRAQSAIVF